MFRHIFVVVTGYDLNINPFKQLILYYCFIWHNCVKDREN